MKKLLLLSLFVLVPALIFLGCGKDGEDGKAYLSFTWDWYVDAYTDDNSGVPYTIRESEEYEVRAGTYNYEYYCSDGYGNTWGYEGRYTIEINEGKDGGFLTNGEDGEDNHYRMDLSGTGTTYHLNKAVQKKSTLVKKIDIDLSLYNKVPVGNREVKTYYTTGGSLTVTRQMFELVKK